jgi:hypothetical protein
MPERIKQRVGSRWWRLVEVTGCVTLAGGLAFIMYSLDGAIRTEENAGGNMARVLTGCAVLFLGFVMAAAARQSDTRRLCSRCGEQLRFKDDRACVRCQTILD